MCVCVFVNKSHIMHGRENTFDCLVDGAKLSFNVVPSSRPAFCIAAVTLCWQLTNAKIEKRTGTGQRTMRAECVRSVVQFVATSSMTKQIRQKRVRRRVRCACTMHYLRSAEAYWCSNVSVCVCVERRPRKTKRTAFWWLC